MTAIAIILVILAAVPTSLTLATQSEDPARTTIVGAFQVSPASSQSDRAAQDENIKLNERLQALENRVALLESKLAGHGKQGHSKHPD
jgi:hypothetical protein